MLPASAGGWTRTEVESQGGGAGGFGGSRAAGVYTAGENRVTLSVSDMAAMGALATLGGAFNVQSSKTTADGYERTGQVATRRLCDAGAPCSVPRGGAVASGLA